VILEVLFKGTFSYELNILKGVDKMIYLVTMLALGFLAGCGDKDSDDSGSDTAEVADSSDSVSE
jgi:hypothetical protein